MPMVLSLVFSRGRSQGDADGSRGKGNRLANLTMIMQLFQVSWINTLHLARWVLLNGFLNLDGTSRSTIMFPWNNPVPDASQFGVFRSSNRGYCTNG
ncbi:hypothetical protein V6N11_053611 [Hibiscus sabdariffa]|uniref:Uncharacterized protein n=1 Tax=Hibiscus sabdariffa TaxID=183260 RepID=A0ABR2UDR7_9ROSI